MASNVDAPDLPEDDGIGRRLSKVHDLGDAALQIGSRLGDQRRTDVVACDGSETRQVELVDLGRIFA